jgi:hypothetical protein
MTPLGFTPSIDMDLICIVWVSSITSDLDFGVIQVSLHIRHVLANQELRWGEEYYYFAITLGCWVLRSEFETMIDEKCGDTRFPCYLLG